jgi:CRISPR-associated protein Cas5d
MEEEMPTIPPPLEVRVWGPYACFTRPELKVERATYEVMTPSAARGLLEAIFWKPEFSWRVREIRVLRPITLLSIRRNEVASKLSIDSVRRWGPGEGYFAEEDRTQRTTMVLRDVAYVIVADVVLRPHVTDDVAKYRDQFRRRVDRGACAHTPYLGNREFRAFFEWPDPGERPQPLNRDLGRMLFDLDYRENRGMPRFFDARLVDGVVHIPQQLYREA